MERGQYPTKLQEQIGNLEHLLNMGGCRLPRSSSPLGVKNCRAVLREARLLCPRKLPRHASTIVAV